MLQKDVVKMEGKSKSSKVKAVKGTVDTLSQASQTGISKKEMMNEEE